MKTTLFVTASLMIASAAPLPAKADDAANVRGYYALLAYEKCSPGSFNPKALDGVKTLIAISALSIDVRWIETQMMSLSCVAVRSWITPEKVLNVNAIYGR